MYKFSRKYVICDIGAALIDDVFPYQRLMDSGIARTIGFEPDLDAIDRLNALQGDHEFLPYFIGDGQDHIFHVNSAPLTSSLLPSNTEFLAHYRNLRKFMATQETVACKTVTLDDALGDRPVDFLKIDVQGGSKMIVENAPKVLDRCPLVQCEVEFNPLYKDQPLFGDVDSVMRQHGFMLFRMQENKRMAIEPLSLEREEDYLRYGQEGWADFIYVPNHDRFDTLDTEDAIRLGLFATTLFGLNDYSMHVFDRLDRANGTNLLTDFSFMLRDRTPIKFSIAGEEGIINWG